LRLLVRSNSPAVVRVAHARLRDHVLLGPEVVELASSQAARTSGRVDHAPSTRIGYRMHRGEQRIGSTNCNHLQPPRNQRRQKPIWIEKLSRLS